MEDVKNWGLSGRLALMVLAAVGITLAGFFLLTVLRLEAGAVRQGEAVQELAWQRMDAQMRLQHRLVAGDLEQIKQTADRQMRQLAGLETAGQTLARGNVVAIDAIMQQMAQSAQMDGVLALDTNLNAVGSHRPGLPLVLANRAFSEAGFAPLARGFLVANERDNPRSYTDYATLESDVLTRLGTDATSRQLVLLSMQVVFDDFGDPIALLVAHRMMNRSLPALERFAREEHLRVTVQDGAAVLVDIAPDKDIKLADTETGDSANGSMGMNGAGDTLFRCSAFGKAWRLCIMQPFGDLQELTAQLTTHIADEKTSLIVWLGLLGIAGLVMAVLITAYVARRVLAPLGQITTAVRSVAKGNWLVHVAGQKRGDEVGAIARSVTVLQQSMKERERLKADMADVEQLRSRASAMAHSAQDCRTSLRREMFVLSEMAERIEAQTAQLTELSTDAVGEADETMLAAQRVLASLANKKDKPRKNVPGGDDVLASLDRMTGSIGSITEANRDIALQAQAIADRLTAVERTVEAFNGAIRDDGTEPSRRDIRSMAAVTSVTDEAGATALPATADGVDLSAENHDLFGSLLRASRLAVSAKCVQSASQ